MASWNAVRGSLRFLLKGHGGGLFGVGLRRDGSNGQRDDLATVNIVRKLFHANQELGRIPEAEEVADLLLGGCGRDARDVDGGVARHDG